MVPIRSSGSALPATASRAARTKSSATSLPSACLVCRAISAWTRTCPSIRPPRGSDRGNLVPRETERPDQTIRPFFYGVISTTVLLRRLRIKREVIPQRFLEGRARLAAGAIGLQGGEGGKHIFLPHVT